MSRKLSELVAKIKSLGKSESDIIKVLETEFSSEIEKFEKKSGLDESDYLMRFIVWSRDSTINYMFVTRIAKCLDKDKYAFSGPKLTVDQYSLDIGSYADEDTIVFSILDLPRVLTRKDLKESIDRNLENILNNLKSLMRFGGDGEY